MEELPKPQEVYIVVGKETPSTIQHEEGRYKLKVAENVRGACAFTKEAAFNWVRDESSDDMPLEAIKLDEFYKYLLRFK